MASTPRWGGLRIEPYSPDADDADGDGIVQEGTAWERPAGTKIFDQLGREIVKGATSSQRMAGISYRDRNGKSVDYTPAGASGPDAAAPTSALGRLGAPNLRELGHVSAHEMNVSARTAPANVPSELAPTPETPKPSTELGASFLEQTARIESRVSGAFGLIETRDDAVAALTRAFPLSSVESLESQLPDGPLSSRDRGHVVGLLHASLDDPNTAAVTRISLNAISLGDRTADTTWGFSTPNDGELPRVDLALLLNPVAEGLPEDSAVGRILSTLSTDGVLSPAEIENLSGIYASTHAYAHANLARQSFAHAGLALEADGQDRAWWFKAGSMIGLDFEEVASRRKYRKSPSLVNAHIAETMSEQLSLEALAGIIKEHRHDDLRVSERFTLEDLAQERSGLAVDPLEIYSELMTLRVAGVDPIETPPQEQRSVTLSTGEVVLLPEPSRSEVALERVRRETKYQEPLAKLRAWLEADHIAPPPPPSARDTIVGRAGGVAVTDQSGQAPFTPMDRDRSITTAANTWIIDPGGLRSRAERIMGRSQLQETSDVTDSEVDSEGSLSDAHTLLAEIRDNGTAIGRAYRGLDPGEEVAREIGGLQPGDLFEAPLIGVTRERHIAGARFNGERPGGALIIFEDAHGISINGMLPQHQYADEDEWILSGQFEVVSVETRAASRPVKPPRGSALSDFAQSVENVYGSDYPEDIDPSTPITVVTVRHVAVFDPDVNMPEAPRSSARTAPQAELPVVPDAVEPDLSIGGGGSVLGPINEPRFTVNSFEKGLDWSVIPADTLATYRQQLQDDINVGLGPNMGRLGFEPTEDKALVTLVQAQGFDAPATPVAAEEADAIVAAGGLEIWRGLGDPSHAEALRHGDYYGGRGISGGGHYFAEAPSMGGEYSKPTAGDYTGVLTKMILRPEAKVADIDDIKALMLTIDNDPNSELLTYDYGHFAIAMGYDAIRVPETEETSQIIVVLNRGACVLPPQPDNDELRALVSDPRAGRPKAVEQEQSLKELTERIASSEMSLTEQAELWISTLRERRAAGLFTRSYEHRADPILLQEVQSSFDELQNSPSFRAMSPQEQLTYIESLIDSRGERGLYTSQYSQLAGSLKAQVRRAEPSVPDDEDGYDGSGAFV